MINIENVNLAAIDIGSNAARLLIKNLNKDLDGNTRLTKVMFLRIPLRLGVDVFGQGKISETKEEHFLRMIKAFNQLMKIHDVVEYRACATSALRDAKNGKRIIKKIGRKTGIKIDIISGQEEARIIYDNHIEASTGPGNFLYVDVGGGSTEISFISNKERISSTSYNVGTLRMLSGTVRNNVLLEMKQDLENITAGYSDITIIGSGGNINKLYRIASKRDKRKDRLPVAALEKLYDHLSKQSVAERMEVFSLKPDRADVIVPAAELFLNIARSVQAESILVPTFGLADGIIKDLASKYKEAPCEEIVKNMDEEEKVTD